MSGFLFWFILSLLCSAGSRIDERGFQRLQGSLLYQFKYCETFTVNFSVYYVSMMLFSLLGFKSLDSSTFYYYFFMFILLYCTIKWKWRCMALYFSCIHTKKLLFHLSFHLGLPLLIIYHPRVLFELNCWYIYISVVGVKICNTQFGSYSSSHCFGQTGRSSCFLGLGQFWGTLFKLLPRTSLPLKFFLIFICNNITQQGKGFWERVTISV